MKILSIGNSFSQDAQRYFHSLAEENGADVKCVNLYIPGCSLKTHYDNTLEDAKNYSFEFNGVSTGINVSIKEALLSDKWNYITLQQVSHEAPFYSTYIPYLNELAKYVRDISPESKLLIHQTWAYEENSRRLTEELKYEKPEDMMKDIREAYEKACADIKADGIIPSGDVLLKALELGVPKIHRDTFHCSYGIGRYALALTWYAYFTKLSPADVRFSKFDVEVSEKDIDIVKKAVKAIFGL